MIIDLSVPFYSFERLQKDAKKLADTYREVIQYVTIGESHDHRDIFLLKLGRGQKHFICCAGVHGRETVNPVVLLRILEYYANEYAQYADRKEGLSVMLSSASSHYEDEYKQVVFGACIHELLQTFTILFIPLLNPDGYMISLAGFDAVRNMELQKRCMGYGIPHTDWKLNARGVDINRNFPSRLWKPKNSGDYAASENETRALIAIFHQYKSLGFLDLHSRGESIYYYRKEMSDYYNERQLAIAERLKEITGYRLVPPEEEIDPGDSGGNTVHYYSEHFRRTAITIETVNEDAPFPLDIGFRQAVFEELKFTIFEFGSLIL